MQQTQRQMCHTSRRETAVSLPYFAMQCCLSPRRIPRNTCHSCCSRTLSYHLQKNMTCLSRLLLMGGSSPEKLSGCPSSFAGKTKLLHGFMFRTTLASATRDRTKPRSDLDPSAATPPPPSLYARLRVGAGWQQRRCKRSPAAQS